MKEYTAADVKDFLRKICGVCHENQERFTEADSRLGDGDMGSSMDKGAAALEKFLDSEEGKTEDLTMLFLGCAADFNRAAPSTLGTLISFGLMAAGKQLGHKSTLKEDEIPVLAQLFADTIALRGKAKPGDKTILDALYPLVETLQANYEKEGLEAALAAAAKAAKAGMESTKGVKAKMGRAKWLDTRNMEYPDAGAVLCVTVAEGLVR